VSLGLYFGMSLGLYCGLPSRSSSKERSGSLPKKLSVLASNGFEPFAFGEEARTGTGLRFPVRQFA
jgi:hypothetical protein